MIRSDTPATPDAATLERLARAWQDGENVGPALHDALEEAGWPLMWIFAQGRHNWWLRGTSHTLVFVRFTGWVWEVGGVGIAFSAVHHQRPSLVLARLVAETALRRALLENHP